MKTLIRIEELMLAVLAFLLFRTLDVAWWWYPVLLLTPDVSMLGYLLGPRVGAGMYNLVHHKGVAIVTYGLGLGLGNTTLQLAGLVLLGHSSLDRAVGYGLKYPDSFQHTHLGWIGRAHAGRGAR